MGERAARGRDPLGTCSGRAMEPRSSMNPKSKPPKSKAQIPLRHEVSAGGLVWRRRNRALEIVLVRPAGRTTWVLPKGHLEPGEGPIEAAVREVAEETGLRVVSGAPLGEVFYIYTWRDRPNRPMVRIAKRVHFFLMECAGGNPADHDGEIDEVVWLALDDALRRASHKSERELIEKARAMLAD